MLIFCIVDNTVLKRPFEYEFEFFLYFFALMVIFVVVVIVLVFLVVCYYYFYFVTGILLLFSGLCERETNNNKNKKQLYFVILAQWVMNIHLYIHTYFSFKTLIWWYIPLYLFIRKNIYLLLALSFFVVIISSYILT